jgi:hypothetical protein
LKTAQMFKMSKEKYILLQRSWTIWKFRSWRRCLSQVILRLLIAKALVQCQGCHCGIFGGLRCILARFSPSTLDLPCNCQYSNASYECITWSRGTFRNTLPRIWISLRSYNKKRKENALLNDDASSVDPPITIT